MNIKCVNCGRASFTLWMCPRCGKSKRVREESRYVPQSSPAAQSDDYLSPTNPFNPLSPFHSLYSPMTDTPSTVVGGGGAFDGGGASSNWDASPSSSEPSSYSSDSSSSSSYDSSSSSSYDSGSSSSSDY